jgi:hypothetical protein
MKSIFLRLTLLDLSVCVCVDVINILRYEHFTKHERETSRRDEGGGGHVDHIKTFSVHS